MRFENIDDGPDPEDIQITWLPFDEEGITAPHPYLPEVYFGNEPSIVLLLDGRLFCTMRTLTGYIWYFVSEDDGENMHNADEYTRYLSERGLLVSFFSLD